MNFEKILHTARVCRYRVTSPRANDFSSFKKAEVLQVHALIRKFMPF